MAGGGGLKTKVINFVVANPAQCYLAGGVFLLGVRRLQAQLTYNYWFGKFHFQRKLARGLI